ncbi:nuclear transport factor 2 family protein [Arenibacter aquaticus]|uniref:Nuclear transport factor 2 family protein n=1 Tax=Arenibacter aquaticus TaxID=2489054 RepID=A0A3S0AK27_9FLAO|nr:DUF4440 domain-containing protein [Arenibacter aquaticus]RTE51984.1 nuclear transport factor 2 family protein [Arenibacter aquaticus]
MGNIAYYQQAFTIVLFSLLYTFGHAQLDSSSELYQTIKEVDSILFVEGFNQCKLKEMEPYIAVDLEFYHDKSGLSTSKEAFFEAIKQNICGNGVKKPIRKLVAGSMEVFPLYQNDVLYGAIQHGVHEFYIKEADKDIYITGIAKFSHVFTLQNGVWQLKRVLSYDHQAKE